VTSKRKIKKKYVVWCRWLDRQTKLSPDTAVTRGCDAAYNRWAAVDIRPATPEA
jgi:hypothetical protein